MYCFGKQGRQQQQQQQQQCKDGCYQVIRLPEPPAHFEAQKVKSPAGLFCATNVCQSSSGGLRQG